MGISLLMLAASDMYYKELFPSYTHLWTQGLACKVTGFLSIVSNECSVFLITLISIDRYLGMKFPFGDHRFSTTTARVSVSFVWFISALIAAIAVGLAGEKSDIFTTSEVCIGIPIIRRQKTEIKTGHVNVKETNLEYVQTWTGGEFSDSTLNVARFGNVIQQITTHDQEVSYPNAEITGSTYSPILSLIIFIAVNSICFIVVASCYIGIFRTVTKSSKNVTSTQNSKSELSMARKMFFIVFTDFCCWVPLCIACILAQCQVITISPEMYAWIIGFILPINSAINPIVYVMQEEISDYFKKKSKSNSNPHKK